MPETYDVATETALTFPEASKTTTGNPSICTLHRWRLRGVRGVRLETFLRGGRRFTSAEAVQRFIQRTTAAANGERPTSRTPKARALAAARANKELATAGW